MNSTGFKKSSSAFLHLGKDNTFAFNKDCKYLLETKNANNDDLDDPEIDRIIEEIDAELGFCNFSDLDEFVKFNEKR